MQVSSFSSRTATSVERQLCSPTLSSSALSQTSADTAIRITRWGDPARVASTDRGKVEAYGAPFAQPALRSNRSSLSFIKREETPL